MELEKLVCTLKIAKMLKKLGVRQESLFYWTEFYNTSSTTPNDLFAEIMPAQELVEMREKSYITDLKTYSAYTSQEIADLYPREIWITVREKSFKKQEAEVYFVKHDDIYKVALMIPSPGKDEVYEYHREEDENESNARAKFLAYLHKTNLVNI